jgi:hypothetical protein
MARKTKEQLEVIKKKYNQSRIWSWSRYNCYKNSPYEYFLKYVKHEKPTRESIYGVLGNSAHNIIERFYDSVIEYEDMINEFYAAYLNAELMDLKFDRTDENKNENIARKYFACMEHFFQNHQVIEQNIALEKFLLIKVGSFLFQGYLDAITKDEDGCYVITDWKTSTVYSGKKIDQEKGQLLLYADALIQKGIPIKSLKIRWNFMKYLNIIMPLKNGKTRTSRAERHAWVGKIKNNAKMWMKDMCNYTDDEIEDMLSYSLTFNTIDNLPQKIQDLYTVEDCYVYANINQEEIDNLKQEIYDTLVEIYTKEKEYEKTKDDKVFWETVTDQQSYYFANLCSYNASQHKPYGEYLDKQQMFVNDEYKTDKHIVDINDDLEWMKELNLI